MEKIKILSIKAIHKRLIYLGCACCIYNLKINKLAIYFVLCWVAPRKKIRARVYTVYALLL